jgi:hypothetical protein
LASRVGQYADERARLSKLFNFSDKNFLEVTKEAFPLVKRAARNPGFKAGFDAENRSRNYVAPPR